MTKDELQSKYGDRWNILSEPASECDVCKGTGEVKTRSEKTPMRPCLCVCTRGSAELRAQAAETMRDTVRKIASRHTP